ncbi:MAG: hypothetical protein C7B45_05930 [Sulfobacillus acidophilus]|uniref:Uncharacterized protein n=1 Tax=Sulfobacillus acidophilus TaxID=53633 RepID=A0A2T2WK26_9FIRM|nr:MAG: hypothetical protein C7B45_05930 [Sulfobacillus acidophilus]
MTTLITDWAVWDRKKQYVAVWQDGLLEPMGGCNNLKNPIAPLAIGLNRLLHFGKPLRRDQ